MVPFAVSFLITALVTPLVIAAARRLGWVDRPRQDRWHSRPTAQMGGIAIFLGAAIAWLACEDLASAAPVAVPAAILFVLGLVDDRVHLRPHVKLIGQVTAAAVLLMGHVRFQALPPLVALPLTLLWVVGITNAVNLLDNMDGLAAGVCSIAAVVLAAYSHAVGSAGTAAAALALAGGCAGFLIYNFHPARIFMGDCGSMFLGFSLAALAVQSLDTGRSAPGLLLSLLVPVALLAIPIFDTTLVSVARTLHGRPISQGGRDHSSHRLVALGFSERGTVLVLYALTALFGGLALATTRLPLLVVVILAALLFAGLAVLGLYLGFLTVYGDEAKVPADVRLLGGSLLYKKQILQVLLDIHLVPVAFVGAHLLRFEGALPDFVAAAVFSALPFVLVAKLVGLALCRAYRGVWRYAGMADVLTAAAGSVVGSLIAAVWLGLDSGFAGLSRAALIIDWLLFTTLVVAARTGFVMLRELFAMLPPRNAPRVVILGAGDEALVLVRRLRDPLSPIRADVVGIVDDDPGKRGRALNGVPVLGPLSELPRRVAEGRVTCCLLGVPSQSEAGAAILEFCRSRSIPVYRDLDAPLFATGTQQANAA